LCLVQQIPSSLFLSLSLSLDWLYHSWQKNLFTMLEWHEGVTESSDLVIVLTCMFLVGNHIQCLLSCCQRWYICSMGPRLKS
jgi:hypothetical protein